MDTDDLAGLPLDDDNPDPYRPDATIEERVDHIIGVLLCDPNPVRRYHTIRELQDGRLRDIAAVSLRQLRDELGTTEAAAEAVGISRQAANELLGKAGAPGAREDRATRDKPTYWYGQYLEAVRACIDSLPDDRERELAMSQWYRMQPRAEQSLSAVTKAAQRWRLKIKRQRRNVAEKRARELDERGARIAEWVVGRQSKPRLSVQEQMEVAIGYHAARTQRREGRDAVRSR